METIPLHIEYLLTRHDCVIVPGFGAFIATETEAYIDFENGLIRPRRREISFNSSVVTDDGLLSHSIARRERLSYEDARRRVAAMTEKMKADLINEGEVSVGMVGRLIQDSEGLVSFQPRQSASSVDLLEDIRIEKLNDVAVTDPEVNAPQADAEAHETPAEDGMRTIRVAPDRYVFTVSKRAVHVAAMLVTILTIGLSLLIPINHDNEQKASVISIEDFFHHRIVTDGFKAEDTGNATIAESDTLAVVKTTEPM